MLDTHKGVTLPYLASVGYADIAHISSLYLRVPHPSPTIRQNPVLYIYFRYTGMSLMEHIHNNVPTLSWIF